MKRKYEIYWLEFRADGSLKKVQIRPESRKTTGDLYDDPVYGFGGSVLANSVESAEKAIREQIIQLRLIRSLSK